MVPVFKLRHLAQALDFCEEVSSHATLMIGFAEHSKKRLFQESLEFFLLVPLKV